MGFYDLASRLHCNPYLVIEEGEAVLIDAGSRPDFSSVMMKVLELIEPSAISAIILQHYDPDLCGSVPVFEEMIDNPGLRVITHGENRPFIRHYGVASPIECFEDHDCRFTFASGRELHFHRTPFAHSAGSFVTHDPRTGTVFSSDLFGSFSQDWELFLRLDSRCASCSSYDECTERLRCPLPGILDFHRRLMTSCKALRHAVRLVENLAPRIIAPQHGSILDRSNDITLVSRLLGNLDAVGIDAYEVLA